VGAAKNKDKPEGHSDNEHPATGKHHKQTPVSTVNDDTGGRQHRDRGDRLDQVESAQQGAGTGYVINQPVDGNLLDPLAGVGQDAAAQQEAEIPN